MKKHIFNRTKRCTIKNVLLGAAVSSPLIASGIVADAHATEPCDDFGECKVIIEINASDGDLGFHWLVDADDLNSIRIDDPDGTKVYENKAYGPLVDQKMTETFGESSEPVCKEALKEDEDDVVVTVEDFVDRWAAGTYEISGSGDGGEKLSGETELSHYLPAAPQNVTYNAGMITWTAGDDLGACATNEELDDLFADGVLPVHPENVTVVAWEVAFAVEGHPNLDILAHIPAGNPLSMTLPGEITTIIATLPANTPAKIEVGAIGGNLAIGDVDNATFTEAEACLNGVGCGE